MIYTRFVFVNMNGIRVTFSHRVYLQEEERQRQLRERARRLIAEARAGMGKTIASKIPLDIMKYIS